MTQKSKPCTEWYFRKKMLVACTGMGKPLCGVSTFPVGDFMVSIPSAWLKGREPLLCVLRCCPVQPSTPRAVFKVEEKEQMCRCVCVCVWQKAMRSSKHLFPLYPTLDHILRRNKHCVSEEAYCTQCEQVDEWIYTIVLHLHETTTRTDAWAHTNMESEPKVKKLWL